MKYLIPLLLLPALLFADPEPWMKKENPNEMPLLFSLSGDCNLPMADLHKLVSGVLIRSRIRPLTDSGAFNLLISVNCGEQSGTTNILMNVAVDFLGVMETGDGFFLFRYGELGYESYGVGTRSDLEGLIRSKVESAITDYIEVNFDLGEDD